MMREQDREASGRTEGARCDLWEGWDADDPTSADDHGPYDVASCALCAADVHPRQVLCDDCEEEEREHDGALLGFPPR